MKFSNLILQSLAFILSISCTQSKSNASTNETIFNLLTINAIVNSQKSCSLANKDNFWVRNLSLSSQASYCVESTLVASSSNMDLYLEKGLSTNLNYSNIVNAFESNIFPIEKDAFGSPSDINRDGKVSVLILDIKDGATSTSGFVAGFVDPINFYEDNSVYSIRSNQREILFMDGVELLRLRDRDLASGKPDTFLSTLAHEFQHLIRFPYSQGNDDTWIDEGTSEVSSDLAGYGPQTSRLNCFKGDASSSSSCTGGIGSTSIGSPSLFNWTSTLKNYAYSYSFMKYLYENSGIDLTSRNNFFRQSVQGVNGIRATNAYNLMTIFMNAKTFNPNMLSSDNKTAFKYIMASFLGQAVGYANLNTVYLGNTIPVNIDFVRTNYPFSPTLSLLSSPAPFASITKPSSFSLTPSQVSRVRGTTTGLTSGFSDFVIVSNGNTEFLIFNGDNIGSKTNVSSGVASIVSPIEYPELDLNIGSEIICPNEHFHKIHKIEQSKYNLKLYEKGID